MVLGKTLSRASHPLIFGIILMMVSLPLGFYLNSLDSRLAGHAAGHVSDLFSIGLGFVLAYAYIDRFNERAEQRKFRDVDAISIHGVGHAAANLAISVMATLSRKQEKATADVIETLMFNLVEVNNKYFADDREQTLKGLIAHIGEVISKINPDSALTEKLVKDFLTSSEKLGEQITDVFVQRILLGRISAEDKEVLLSLDEGIRNNFSSINKALSSWAKHKANREFGQRLPLIAYAPFVFLLQNCFFLILEANRLQEGTEYRNHQRRRYREGKTLTDFEFKLGTTEYVR